MLNIKIIAALFTLTTVAAKDFLCVKRDCGAVPKTSIKATLNDTLTNAHALQSCMKRASEEGPKLVVVPKGYAFSAMATKHTNLTDVTLQIDGIWEASQYNDSWPLDDSSSSNNHPNALDFLYFQDSTNLTIRGEGTVDGLGYDWWIREWKKQNKHGRPCLLKFRRVQTSEITGVKWLNSPYWNMDLGDIDSSYIHDFEIKVDILRQKASISEAHKPNTFEQRFNDFTYNFMLHFFRDYQEIIEFFFSGKTEWDSAPTMPLNTDGIDPSGSNVTIKNVKITNWDDAVAVKPSHKTDKVAKDGCSQDIFIQNMTVLFGVGATIGSVPPSSNHACVRRVHFKDVDFAYPAKAIYVKTNPGSGTGEIKDIFYENINIFFPLWFGIYIGPQQQQQPGGGGPGCMTYPFEKCETQPLIDVSNITLKNLTSVGGFSPPGIVRCNSTNPCKDINFIDVNVTGWWKDFNWTFISEYADGKVANTIPDPMFKDSKRVFELYTVEHTLDFIDQVVGFYKKDQTNILGFETLAGIVLWAIGMALN